MWLLFDHSPNSLEMEKLESKLFKGIEFIQLGDLPDEQYKAFMSWVGQGGIITIRMNGKTCKDCVQYSDYSYWFETVFLNQQSRKQDRKISGKGKSFGLAFDNK